MSNHIKTQPGWFSLENYQQPKLPPKPVKPVPTLHGTTFGELLQVAIKDKVK